MHLTDAGDDAGAGRLAVILVLRDEQSKLEKARVGIAQFFDALARRELFLLVLAGNSFLAAACAQPGLQRADLVAQLAKSGGRSTALAYASCCCRSANHFFI